MYTQFAKMLSSARTLVREYTELVVFFFFLTTSLFLGDGKQPFVDVWWALGILTMYGVRYYQRGKLDLRALPHPVGFLWAVLVLYYIILTPFSDSAGYSITATIRLIEGYLVYVMFSGFTRDSRNRGSFDSGNQVVELFIKGLLFVGVVATLASFVFLLIPSWTSFLPPMNLLYAAYGHNHLADLLLFTIPIAIGMVERKRSTMTVGMLVFFLVGMALTLARGAWIILIGYLLFVFLKKKGAQVKVFALVGAAALAATLLLVSFLSANKTTGETFQNVSQVSRLLQKSSLLEDGRWEYWRQAIEAIKERPLLGSGPGTFYLESKRLQARPNSYSWFAHSFPLETMVEVGLVGVIPLFLLLCLIVYSIRKGAHTQQHSLDYPGLVIGATLTLAYSFYEFNLDYVVVWLLLWATLGILADVNSDTKTAHVKLQKNLLLWCSLGYISLYYLSYIGSALLSFKNLHAAILAAPYRTESARQYLGENQQNTLATMPVFSYLYRNDADIIFLIAQNLDRQGNTAAGMYFEKSAHLDPYNQDYKKKHFAFLVKNGLVDAIGKQVKLWGDALLVGTVQKEAAQIDFSSPTFTEGYKTIFFNEAHQQPQTPEELSTLYYQLGLSVLLREPQRTLGLWTLARDSAPEWGYYHAELASLMLYVFRDETKAKKILTDCQEYQYPAELCRVTLRYWNDVPKPGSFEKEIQEIAKTRE